jgi:N-acetylglutamate synthase-like GNAT family acetyltransferase
MMKPLLILAPSPTRWRAVEDLLGHEEEMWRDDIHRRLVDGVADCRDAFAVIPEGSHLLAAACIRRRHDVGVLGHVFTRPDQRQRGRARALMQALLSWFDVTGGRWLYVTSPRDLTGGLFEKFGFGVLRSAEDANPRRVTMLRTPAKVGENPLEKRDGHATIRDATRADWVLIVALLQHQPAADPRVSLEESALAAEVTALQLIQQQEQGACRLLVACRDDRVVGVGSLATGQAGERTYAMVLPHDRPPERLREVLLESAQRRGYTQVDFPMEALGNAVAGTSDTAGGTGKPP